MRARKTLNFRLSKDGIVSSMVEYGDTELLWKLHDDECYEIHIEMRKRKLTSAKLHTDLKGKARDSSLIDGVGQCRRIHFLDALHLCRYLGVKPSAIFTTRGAARARARDLPCGTGWKDYESNGLAGGCIKLG